MHKYVYLSIDVYVQNHIDFYITEWMVARIRTLLS